MPRKHKELLVLAAETTVEVSPGLFIANSRSRRADIPTERAARLTELGSSRHIPRPGAGL
ncbi:hypothetical protein ABH930_006189 [Kitasatospora sp. GAS204A]|nr:hypothetical protein [Kitasatospora sp. GAS204B]MDH6120227.1 hypothetical protein [Kitasatospora sp. GAS204B]